jgi:HNH endonuclease
MAKNNIIEKWKTIKFGEQYVQLNKIQVSNLGRLRTYNQQSNGNIINGSLVEGYPIIRLKLYTPRTADFLEVMEKEKSKIEKKERRIKKLILNKERKVIIKEEQKIIQSLQLKYSALLKTDTKSRTVNYHSLVHRLVATYFLPKPKPSQTLVAHIDYNKANNVYANLKWVSTSENIQHQKNSPLVVAEKKNRLSGNVTATSNTKLNIKQVMQIKKLLLQKKPMGYLVQQFKVTETQIYRIKRGENWAEVPAAK